MCVACAEFIKGTLTFREYNSALRETTRDDERHLLEIEAAQSAAKNDPEALKKRLQALQASRSGKNA